MSVETGEECDCDCHESAWIVHMVPCCYQCENCLKRFADPENLEAHIVVCKDKL